MSLEERVAALESRLRSAEDHLAILRVLNTYGRCVDTARGRDAADLWADDGFLDVVGMPRKYVDDIAAALGGTEQQSMNSHGCMHFVNSPKITIAGDSAEAVTYNLVVLHYQGSFNIWRAAVNHWVFTRTAEGWKVKERYSSAVDGSDEAQKLIMKAKD